ncbi:transglycosylase domain-containing protein [Kitasatospora sp. YST-16]|uniref:transglycosylase domain-containing protein n=1 Tax=Kitasatospora sp. YST-16 TaxID=2998080 RepID=UPI002284A51C|nr:transglycosylase domain-containing protein [Kitasatospora sp. YST-16]WAL71895.1 transglycosylase domain-containing protein [Kitasatospora sp. YST-16]WNW37939.1 transglycosylase domain-containing protein [Streptomyces sp. Li-HN-5-13]
MPRKPRERKKRTGWRRLIPTWRITLLGLAASVLLGVGLFALGIALVKVPDAHAAATAQSNTWLYADGSVLARTGQTNRQNVSLDKVSPEAQHAALAAEDRNFYSEGAVNLKGMARAAFNTASGGSTQGGSTITQQYVKNAYLNQKQTVSRKVKEVFIAIKVDATQSKDEILSSYLNTSYYGRGAYGIQAAAQAYFGVDASRLTAAQGAYLATLLNAPSAFDVSSASEAGKQKATARWNYVLDGMVAKKWLGAEERQHTAFPEVLAPKSAPGLSGQAGYLVAAATSYLTDHGIVSDAQLAQGGYTITLTVDPKKQQQLQDAVQTQLTDNLKPDSRKVDAAAQAGAVSVDPKSGQVLALYGGADATKHWIDNATRTDYQAGSTFKAIALAAALDSGARTQSGERITADTVYDGTNRRPVRGAKGTPYAPPNEGEHSYGQISLQQATDWSVNSVFAQLAQDTGLERVRATAVALGLPADTPGLSAVPSIPLGAATPSALELAGVYATLDNDGQQITPWLVKGLEAGGEQVVLPEHKTAQAISKDAARATTSILQGVVDDQGGTGYRAAALNRPVAGKTGTTDDSRSVWFAGYTPELVTVVGLFGQEPGTGKQVSLDGVGGTGSAAGGKYPAQIWTAYMKSALAGQPVTDFAGPTRAPAASAPSGTPSGSASPSQSPSAADSASSTPSPSAGDDRPSASPSARPSGGSGASPDGGENGLRPTRSPSARPSGGAGRSPSASTAPGLGGAGGLLGDQYQPAG